MTKTKKGYLRIKSGKFRDQYAHRAYAARQLGRPLRDNEEIHHLCRNRACWPPSDYHLLICDAAIHHAIDGGNRNHKKGRACK